MKPEIKRNIFGQYKVKFDCPECGVRLTSPLTEAGEVDDCPDCRAKFRVPGIQQREAYEARLAKNEAEKEAERRLRNEERRIAAEDKRLRQEERRLQMEEEQRRRELIIAEEEEKRRRNELANMPTPDMTGKTTDEDDITDSIHPDAEKRVSKLVGWFSTEWERRPNVACPYCGQRGFIVAKITGLFSGNRWQCCNCEAEEDGTVDGIDGKASTRLQQAERNQWKRKQHVVCQHCQVRGYVVFKTTTFGRRNRRKCCNCDVQEEFV